MKLGINLACPCDVSLKLRSIHMIEYVAYLVVMETFLIWGSELPTYKEKSRCDTF